MAVVRLVIVSLLAAFAGSRAVDAAPAAGAPGGIRIEVSGAAMSAEVPQAPMVDVLAVVARQLGAPILVRGELGATRAQSFQNAPLLHGLERLTAPNRLMVEYGVRRGGGGAAPIERIRVFGDGAAGERRIEPVAIEAGAPPAKTARATPAAAPAAAPAPALREGPPPDDPESPLTWSYDDEELPPAAVRLRKLGAVGPTSGEGGLAALSGVLDADPDPTVRAAAVRALAGFHTETSEGLLEQGLLDDDAQVRLAAASAIAAQADSAPTQLIDLLTDDDEDARVRLVALDALARFPDEPDARDAIRDASEADDPQVRNAARRLLKR